MSQERPANLAPCQRSVSINQRPEQIDKRQINTFGTNQRAEANSNGRRRNKQGGGGVQSTNAPRQDGQFVAGEGEGGEGGDEGDLKRDLPQAPLISRGGGLDDG
jgi:hypothetical protein